MALSAALRDPIPLSPNRIPRFYGGGLLLGRFRGDPAAADDGRPEDWVGSATATWTAPAAPPASAGISPVDVAGRRTTIAELVASEPEAMVGAALLERAGPTPGVLVKLLDAGERLPVHAHPTREAAARLLGSPFGKTEAWLILATRSGRPEPVWAGFREPMDPAALLHRLERQPTDDLLGALTEHLVRPGDVVLVAGGVPHAIGAGILLLELQEPTDFSIVAETRGFPIDDADASLRLGWDRAVEFFDASAAPVVVRPEPDAERLLPADADAYFRLLRQRVARGSSGTAPFDPAYAVGVVLEGSGEVRGAARSVTVRPGDTFALPAIAVAEARIEAGTDLQLAWCLGPDPAALDRAPLPAMR